MRAIQDVRYALRLLASHRGPSLIAVLSLALGIGVNTAIFSVLDTILWKPPPIRDLDRAVFISHSRPGQNDSGASFPGYERYRDQSTVFSGLAAYAGERPLLLTDGERREQLYAEVVTENYFAVVNAPLAMGRSFVTGADVATDNQSVILSHAFWRRRLASDAAIVGKTLIVNGRPFTAIGVAAPEFTGLSAGLSIDAWIPLTAWARLVGEPDRLTNDGHQWVNVVGRLKPGISLPQARAEMSVIGSRMHAQADQSTNVTPASRGLSHGAALEVWAIAAPAFLVGLLILALACGNIANLLLARAAHRQREMAVRLALGGGRGRLVRLWATEGVLLCALGGIVGVLLAMWAIELLTAFQPPTTIGEPAPATWALQLHLDWRVITFAASLSILIGVLVGMVPAFQASKGDLISALKTDRLPGARFKPGWNVRSALVVSQMAGSLLLLILSGLFIRSSTQADAVDLGFSADRVLLLPISENQGGVKVVKPAGFEREIVERVAALPGVVAATVMDPVPLWFGGSFGRFSTDEREGRRRERLGFARVGPHYFQVMQMALVKGREFTTADHSSAPRVAIVNETLARRFWPGTDPIGKRVLDGDQSMEIVGIAKDAKYLLLSEDARPWIYLPLAQEPSTNLSLSLAVRTTGEPMALAPAVEREVRAVLPSWPLFQFRSLGEGLQVQRLLPRVVATMLGVFGFFGMLLAAVGIYGVVSLIVSQRTSEIGLRMAVGAQAADVIRLVIREGMILTAVGAAIGMAVALAASQFLRSVLVRISPADPLTYLSTAALLLVAALAACYRPARQAAQVDPIVALRNE